MIILMGKQLCSLNTKSPKNSLNKENLLIDKNMVARYHNKYGICVVKPIIDKLLITYDLQDFSEEQRQELRVYISKSFPQDGIHDELYTSVPLYLQSKDQYKAYKYSIRLNHKESGQCILIQAVPYSEGKPFMRFDMNPSLLGAAGMEYFKNKLLEDFSLPESRITFKNISKHEKSICRIDVAVDILGLSMEDTKSVFLKAGKPCPSKSQKITGVNGRNESFYLGYKKGNSTNLYLYNKKQEMLDNDQMPFYGNVSHTRVERRIKNTKHALKDIGKLQNHLKKVSIRAIDYHSFSHKDYSHKMFMRLAKERELHKSLVDIPIEKQDEYIDTYQNGFVDIWEPEYLWSLLPNSAKMYGLID